MPDLEYDSAGRFKALWMEERGKREAADAHRSDLTAIVGGMVAALSGADVPLYRRIGNQRRALAALNDIQHVWSNVLTPEERMTFLTRWRENRDA